jgi:hypothetical protein
MGTGDYFKRPPAIDADDPQRIPVEVISEPNSRPILDVIAISGFESKPIFAFVPDVGELRLGKAAQYLGYY